MVVLSKKNDKKKQDKQKIPVLFKKRYNLKRCFDTSLKFGNYGLFFNKGCNLEFIHLAILKRKIKLLSFSKKKNRSGIKIWFFFPKNYLISIKSKNSRMGKGKGSFLRFNYRYKQYTTFFELKGSFLFKLLKFYYDIKKKFPNNLYYRLKKKKFFSLWTKKNKSVGLVSKYKLIIK
uniref:ribosomal protein L16 n=1 Tax=Cryptocaryon irritans TaxID=153251 RepID=UPI0022FD37EE|nr:ribosomal protein L16 [Cryptocaryon irritans]WBP62341.1 ribosomal protein L16 [Cryptocaryon irritans]